MARKKKKTVTKSKLIGVYDIVTIYYGNDEFWTFKLAEWDLYRDYDWVEVVKKDGTGMETFCVHNVIRLSFGMDKVRDLEPTKTDVLVMKPDNSPLKPVA